jgi:hypothetical protein
MDPVALNADLAQLKLLGANFHHSQTMRALNYMTAIQSLNRGTGRYDHRLAHRRGVHPREQANPRARGLIDNRLAGLNVAKGRRVAEQVRSQANVHFILDTSGSMASQGRMDMALGMIASWYLELTASEQKNARLYRYTSGCYEAEWGNLFKMRAAGSTNLRSIMPHLRSASQTDRYVVITDGALPHDVSDIPAQGLIVISLDILQRRSAREHPAFVEWPVIHSYYSEDDAPRIAPPSDPRWVEINKTLRRVLR